MFGVYEDLVLSVAKRVPRRINLRPLRLNVGMAPSAALWCVPPRKRLSGAPRTRADRFFAHRERVVYPDGNSDAVAALSALLAPDTQLTAPDVQVLPADASPALEAALWAASPPRGNRDLAPPVAFPSLPSTETLESLATFDGRRSPSAFPAVSAGRASPAVSEPAPPTPPKEREKRDSLLCDGDTVDAVLGSVFD